MKVLLILSLLYTAPNSNLKTTEITIEIPSFEECQSLIPKVDISSIGGTIYCKKINE
jgi:hypothetical protein